MNDINAACAGGIKEKQTIESLSSKTLEERLITLDKLRASNLINEQEYIISRQKILHEI